MLEVSELIASFAFTTWALFFIVLRDERRLPPHELARAWPPSTRMAALVMLGVFALPVHFARTRRTVIGFCLGLDFAIAVSVANALFLGTIELFFGDGG